MVSQFELTEGESIDPGKEQQYTLQNGESFEVGDVLVDRAGKENVVQGFEEKDGVVIVKKLMKESGASRMQPIRIVSDYEKKGL